MLKRSTAVRVAAAAAAVCGATVTTTAAPGLAGATTPASTDRLSSNFALAVGPAQLMSNSTGCQLGNGVQHVMYIGFDNFHLRRDNSNSVANNGDENHNTDTNIPSDLEQVPALYNFLRGASNAGATTDTTNYADGRNTGYTTASGGPATGFPGGTILTNHHTPLISHTSVDFTTAYTGVYGDRHGVATSQNNIAGYNTSGSISTASGFSYWTDPITSSIPGDNTDVLTTNGASGPVNPPAPWVPFTEAGCDVGAVSATGFVLENGTSVADESTASVTYTSADEGLAVHCTNPTLNPNTICGLSSTDSKVKAVPDVLPNEPGGYSGYSVMFGHKYIAPAVNDRLSNATSGGSTTLALLPGRPSTSSFPGFNGEDGNYTLGYSLDMQKAGIPVTFGYLSDAHDCHSALYSDYNDTGATGLTSKCDYTDAPGTTDPTFVSNGTQLPSAQAFGSGEAGYVNYLKQLNSDFQSFFDQAKANGLTTANTEFVFYSDENDHVSEGTPANPTCDGVTVACQWNHSGTGTANNGVSTSNAAISSTPYSVSGQLGEVNVNLDAILPAESQNANQPYYLNNDSAPEVYLENGSVGGPAQTAANVRTWERDLAGATYTDPYSAATTHVENYAADHQGLNSLHLVTADPLRTPTLVGFAPGEDYVSTSSCPAAVGSAPSCSESNFTYVHGDFAPETDTTWAGFAGPGVLNLGTSNVWTDHTDLRTTLLALVGLHDDYTPDGRVITQIIDPSYSDPENNAAVRSTDAVTLANLLKQLDAPVYQSSEGANDGFGPAILVADTKALASGNTSSDSLYTTVENDIQQINGERNTVVSDIEAQLLGAEVNGTAPTNAANDEAQGNCILTYANALKAYASDPVNNPQPTDCGVPVQTPEVPYTPLLVGVGGAVLAGGIFLTGRRRRAAAIA